MFKSRLMEVFTTLPPPMRRELRSWVRSAFFNLRQDVIALFDYLDSNNFQKPHLFDKEIIFKKVFPNEKKYDDAKMRYVMSFLLKNIEQYLAYTTSIKEPLVYEWYLTVAYRNLNLERHFEHKIEHLRKELNDKEHDAERIRRMFDIEKMYYTFLSERKRVKEPNLLLLSNHLDQFYAAEKLRVVCSVLSYQHIYKKEYDIEDISHVLTQVERNNWQETVSIIGVYYYAYQLYTNPNATIFFNQFKKKIPQYVKNIEPQELRSAYLSAINFAIRQINKADLNYFREVFELYKIGIEFKVLLENQEISPFTYKNIVTIGLRLEEFDYIETFIEQYQSFLPLDMRKNYYDYCRARFFFAIKQYDKAMPILVQLNYGDLYILLDGNVMLCKMYYELKEEEALASFLDAFRHFIRRKRDNIGAYYEAYSNIIRFITRLQQAVYQSFKVRQNLREEIQKCNPLTEKIWLLEQLDKIDNHHK